MKVLVVGSGGREHALAWLLQKSEQVNRVFVAPGNPGTSRLAKCSNVAITDTYDLINFVQQQNIDLTIVGPEVPISLGIVDTFQLFNLPIFAPTFKSSRLEWDKFWALSVMQDSGIPTGSFKLFVDADSAHKYVKEVGAPIVVKANGLAAGKGVYPCQTEIQAHVAIDALLVDGVCGQAGKKIVIMEHLGSGEEISVFVLSDGQNWIYLPVAQDHKRLRDGDIGPNTGGMGAYAPASIFTPELAEFVEEQIVKKTIQAMFSVGCPYVGFLFVGLILTDSSPKVLEFNCRLGDPEAQAILPLLDPDDFVEAVYSAAIGNLSVKNIRVIHKAAACVVMTSAGYPIDCETGFSIFGIETIEQDSCVCVFHAGTALGENGSLLTNGGRVLGLTGVGRNVEQALIRAYWGVEQISFHGAQWRNDIGYRELARMK